MANKVSKTTRKRTKNLKKVKRLVEVFICSVFFFLNNTLSKINLNII